MLETGNAAERLAKLDALKANPNVDVVQVTDFLALEASQKGLLQPTGHGQLKNLGQISDFARGPLRNRAGDRLHTVFGGPGGAHRQAQRRYL